MRGTFVHVDWIDITWFFILPGTLVAVWQVAPKTNFRKKTDLRVAGADKSNHL